MHEDYDDDYDDDEYDYDHPSLNPYLYYFKFDVSPDSPISKWLLNIDWNSMPSYSLDNIDNFPLFQFPVNSWNPDTGKGNSFQYLGSNYQGVPIWKKKYFLSDPINTAYKLHLQSHAKHFISQPTQYKGMFDILN